MNTRDDKRFDSFRKRIADSKNMALGMKDSFKDPKDRERIEAMAASFQGNEITLGKYLDTE